MFCLYNLFIFNTRQFYLTLIDIVQVSKQLSINIYNFSLSLSLSPITTPMIKESPLLTTPLFFLVVCSSDCYFIRQCFEVKSEGGDFYSCISIEYWVRELMKELLDEIHSCSLIVSIKVDH